MNDLPPNGDDVNESNNTPPNHSKSTNTWLEIFLGLGLAAIAYILCISISNTSLSNTMQGLAILAVLALTGMVNVKLFKALHSTAANAMLIATSPLYLGAMLLGACSVLF